MPSSLCRLDTRFLVRATYFALVDSDPGYVRR